MFLAVESNSQFYSILHCVVQAMQNVGICFLELGTEQMQGPEAKGAIEEMI